MPTLPRQGADGALPFSNPRHNQFFDAVEAAARLFGGNGVISGGAVTDAGAGSVSVAAGSFMSEWMSLTTAAPTVYGSFPADGTSKLWGKVLRTPANQESYEALDTHALDLEHTTDGNPPAANAGWFFLRDVVTAAGLVTSITGAAWNAGLGDFLLRSAAGTGNLDLSEHEAGAAVMEFTGALTGARAVRVPAAFLAQAGREWLVFNNTTGAFSLTFQGPTGVGVVITQGKSARVYTNGTNIIAAPTDVVGAGAVPATRLINTTAPLTGGGDLSADRTLAIADATTAAKGVVELATDGENAAGVVVQGNDARLANPRTPTAHAATHVEGGTDAIAAATTLARGTVRQSAASADAAAAVGAAYTQAEVQAILDELRDLKAKLRTAGLLAT